MSIKKKVKNTITLEDYVKANRIGEFEANKDIVGRTKRSVYKSKKNYNRKDKHKKVLD